jgi:steroid delta-isomerase-like uncharacterized protein
MHRYSKGEPIVSTGNAAIVRRGFEEGINARNLAVFDELISPAYVNHSMPAPATGPDGFRQVIQMFVSAFPDLHITLHNVIAEGELVATRGAFTGTHQGEFMGIPATGRQVNVPYIDFWRLEDGKAVENWVQMDMIGMMTQLGVMPAPGQ